MKSDLVISSAARPSLRIGSSAAAVRTLFGRAPWGITRAVVVIVAVAGCDASIRGGTLDDSTRDAAVPPHDAAVPPHDAGTSCVDDAHEDDDSIELAQSRPVVALGTTNGVACPLSTLGGQGDSDYYRLVPGSSANYGFSLVGPTGEDLDLYVIDSDGFVIASSATWSNFETTTAALTSGTTYYVVVEAYDVGTRAPYQLTVD